MATETSVIEQPWSLRVDRATLKGEMLCSGADVLVVVHGGPGESYEVLRPHLDNIAHASGWSVLFYDQRGSGRSARSHEGPYAGWRTHVEDLSAVCASLAPHRVALLGFSFGALLTQWYCSQASHAPSALLLISPAFTGGGLLATQMTERVHTATTRPAMQALRHQLEARKRAMTPEHTAFALRIAPFLANPVLALSLRPVLESEPAAQAVWQSLKNEPPSQGFRVRPPGSACLVMRGSEDPIPPEVAYELGKQLETTVIELPDAGHAPFAEAPLAFNAHVCQVLNTLGES